MGGPKQVNPTSMSIHINCRTDIAKVRDRDGVAIGGGHTSSTRLLYQLGAEICTATLPKKRQRR